MPRSALFDRSDGLALDWSGLYDEHAPRLRRIAARRVGPEQASDVVQEIFVRAYRCRHSIDPARPIGAWLSTLALRASTDALRRRSARPTETLLDEGPLEPVLVGGSVDEEFENIVRREGIKAAFEALPERQQRVFRHLAIDGWTQEEVAADEGMSTEAVKSMFARARHTFKETYQAFADRMGVFGGATVGASIVRLRSRFQRVQGLVTEHVGAFSVAAATVTVVAIATVPSTRPVPTKAVEQSQGRLVTPAGEAISSDGDAGGGPSQSSLPSATTPEIAVDPAPPVLGTAEAAPAAADTEVRAEATASAGRNGSGAGVGIVADTDGPQDDSTTTVDVDVSDCEGVTADAFCLVVEAADQAVGP